MIDDITYDEGNSLLIKDDANVADILLAAKKMAYLNKVSLADVKICSFASQNDVQLLMYVSPISRRLKDPA